jgi:hypothetical protein
MTTTWLSSLLGVASIGGLAALVACTSGTTAKATDTGGADTAKAADTHDTASGDAGRRLETGGALVAPFTCQVDPIQGEPRPGAPLLEQLRVAAGLDALEERLAVGAELDAGTRPGVRAGIPCSGATDHEACETAFAQLSSGGEALRPAFDESDYLDAFFEGSDAGPPGYYLAYTKGDVVGKVSNRKELGAVFPTIDTPAKALLYANAAGYRVECQHADGWLREEADGWVLVASRGHEKRCSRTDVVLFLRRDGTTEERDVIENQPDRCL